MTEIKNIEEGLLVIVCNENGKQSFVHAELESVSTPSEDEEREGITTRNNYRTPTLRDGVRIKSILSPNVKGRLGVEGFLESY